MKGADVAASDVAKYRRECLISRRRNVAWLNYIKFKSFGADSLTLSRAMKWVQRWDSIYMRGQTHGWVRYVKEV